MRQNPQSQNSTLGGPASTPTLEAARTHLQSSEAYRRFAPWPEGTSCPLCGQQHDELVRWLAEDGLRRMSAGDLVLEGDYLRLCLAELTERGELEGPYREYLGHRLRALEDHLVKRRPQVPGQAPVTVDLVAELKRRLDIEGVLSRYVALRSFGPHPSFACPVHGDGRDRSPSGVVYPKEGRYWCFGCNRGGDVLEAVQHFQRVDFRTALELLAREAGIEPKRKGGAQRAGRKVGVPL